jgi:hypothetical protein
VHADRLQDKQFFLFIGVTVVQVMLTFHATGRVIYMVKAQDRSAVCSYMLEHAATLDQLMFSGSRNEGE